MCPRQAKPHAEDVKTHLLSQNTIIDQSAVASDILTTKYYMATFCSNIYIGGGVFFW